ncbi:ribonuclease H-like domain-containing protein [Tanacetum coccineum]
MFNLIFRAAVWDCGSQKSPSPDGFSFLFLKSYWELQKEDVGNAVRCVLESFVMPRGVNSSFITLIPKISNPIHIKDFRPISLIGMQYKIIAKILANRLSNVIDKVVSKEQSAFIAGRQILNGPIVLCELMIRGSEKEMKKVDVIYKRFSKKLLTPQKVLEDMASHTGCGPGGGGSGENKRKGLPGYTGSAVVMMLGFGTENSYHGIANLKAALPLLFPELGHVIFRIGPDFRGDEYGEWCASSKDNAPNMFSIRIHHGGSFRRYPGRRYVDGHVNIFDIVDIDLFSVIALNRMVLQLGYTCEFEPLFYNYLRPVSTLDEGLYALACKEDVRCLATLVRSFKLLEVFASRSPVKDSVCESVTPTCMPHGMLIPPTDESVTTDINLSFVSQQAAASQVIKDVMGQLSFEETELDGEAGFDDVACSGIDSFGLSHDESFGVDDLNLNLNVIVKDYVSYEEDAEQGNGQEAVEAPSTDEDDNEDDDFLVDEENEIVEPDVDMHLFDISMDVFFDNIGATNLVPDDVLKGVDVDVVNSDGFDSDTGYYNETSNYRRRRLDELRREMEGVMNDSVQWKTLPGIPPNLDDWDATLLQSFDFPVYNLYRFLNEIELVIDLDFIQRNDKCFIRQTLLQVRHMECAMDLA